MQFSEYQVAARQTAQYPEIDNNLLYPALGLAGEAGEAVDKVKKLWRNHNVTSGGLLELEAKVELAKEIGDVLWYAAALATELGMSLDDIAQQNITKLLDRQARGVIKSRGDNR